MSEPFFERPILNSPYEYPAKHWELDDAGQPTQQVLEARRRADFITPIPKPRKRSGSQQQQIVFDEGLGLSDENQVYDPTSHINPLREVIDAWRASPESEWRVTPETARLLKHWRHHEFSGRRPFFCQVEAVETAIWLTEVAPTLGKKGRQFLDQLDRANEEANPGLNRLALKLATGAGKTTVMAMIIAWQTVNAVRRPRSDKFTKGFLVVAPGITIKDRLRVLQPNDPDAYYAAFEIVPQDMLDDIRRARIVITNYHAFKLRERLTLSSGGRALLQGRGGELQTLETEGQMLQRVMPELMGVRGVMVINDEAHHCYREKQGVALEEKLKGDAKKEAKENSEAARLWISGIEAVERTLGVPRVIDLSATPFFLQGSGYAEGTLFPWTMSDFSLMDAIECGIVKLPRVPVADNVPGGEMPKLRELWANIKKGERQLPKAGRGKGKDLDPKDLPVLLQTALTALYGHYQKTFEAWESAGVGVPPCFIVVCQNTAISKLVYDFVSGYERENDDGTVELHKGPFDLFHNYDDYDRPLARPNTLLIDSQQLESGEALDRDFRTMAADEIERFRREIRERTGDQKAAEEIADQDLLREVMNTVGKKGRLGEQIRCVVSVSMLTEGWDANTVTHVLGVRAFGTQLLCEQVVGRALRRLSYDLNDDGLFEPEYADVLGIPFDFAAKPVIAPPKPPRPTTHVHAVREREGLMISFPRVEGYRVELPRETLTAEFTEDSVLTLTPELVGPTSTQNSGIIGQTVDLGVKHLEDVRPSTVVYLLATRLMQTTWRETGQPLPTHLFGPLRRVVREWLDGCLECVGGTVPAQLQYQTLADMACEKITRAITRAHAGREQITARLDPYTPEGSTRFVSFHTAKGDLWAATKSHLNYAVLDSDWEAEFCRVAEGHPAVRSYVKNHTLGFEVPYVIGGQKRRYRPDFIVDVDDGHDDPLHLVVEVKGFRGEDAKAKAETMETRWVPGVNHLGTHGRWAFAELREVFRMEEDFGAAVERAFDEMIGAVPHFLTPMFSSTKDDLKKILEQVHNGSLQLPDFQRDYVWNDEDIKSLIASVAKGFPVGALLTLQTGGEVRFKPRALQGATPGHDRPETLLLDGQQRMTSMYQATYGREPVKTKTPKNKVVDRFYYIDIQKALEAGADLGDAIVGVPGDRVVRSNFGRTVELDVSTPEKEYENDYFPLNQSFESRDWFYGWRDFWRDRDRDRTSEEKDFVKHVLERIERYEMPLIQLDRGNSREAICLVFEKVNVGGKKLDAFELLTAVYASDRFDLREDWRGTKGVPGRKDRIVGTEHRRDVLSDTSAMDVLQACSILYTRDLRADAREEGKQGKELPQVSCTRAAVLGLPVEAYQAYADGVEAGYRAAGDFSNELHVYWKRDVPYPSLTLALAAVHAILGHEARTALAKEKMARWYWSVALGELYGSSTETRLARDVPELVRWVRGGDAPRSLDEALFQTSRFRSLRSRNAAAYKAIHALLMDQGARDFITGKEANLMTAHADQIDIHHVFPQKWCKDQGIPHAQYNSVLNKTPLSRRTNIVIGGDAPSRYLRKIEEQEGISAEALDGFLRSHLFDPALVRADDFEGALNARSQALAGLVSDAMGKPVVDTEATNEPETDDVSDIDIEEVADTVA